MRSLANRSGCSLIGHYRLLPVHCVEGKGNAPPSTLMVISSRNTITSGIVSPPHVSVGAVPFLLPWLGCNCQSRKQSRLRCPPSVTAACTESSKRFRIHPETRQRISFTFFHTSPLSARCPPCSVLLRDGGASISKGSVAAILSVAFVHQYHRLMVLRL